MADHSGALSAACPVTAGAILARRKRTTLRGRTGKYVMTIGRISDTGDYLTPLSQRDGHTQFVAVAMQIFVALCDSLPFEVQPGAVAYPIPRIDGLGGTGSLSTQIRAPGFSARSVALR